MKRTALATLSLALAASVGATAPTGPASAAPAPATDDVKRSEMLTTAEVRAAFPDARRIERSVVPSGVLVPKGCGTRTRWVDGEDALWAWMSGPLRPRTFWNAGHSSVEMESRPAAREVMAQYRACAEDCLGDRPDGQKVRKRRAWEPRPLGQQSVGLLEGYVKGDYVVWRRTMIVRTGRRITEVEAYYQDVRPPAGSVVAATRRALARLA